MINDKIVSEDVKASDSDGESKFEEDNVSECEQIDSIEESTSQPKRIQKNKDKIPDSEFYDVDKLPKSVALLKKLKEKAQQKMK